MSNNTDEIRVYKTIGGQFAARTPYHPDFPGKARALGGKWHEGSRVWVFDLRDQARVRDLVESIFGSLEPSGRLVTLRFRISGRTGDTVRLAGRVIAERRGRDAEVRLGVGVVVVEGEFPRSGGSGKYPMVIDHHPDVVVEIRDVDENVAKKMTEQGAEIVG